ncbi:unnamed protein product, partial [Protopolystoma xenopodis]
MENNNNIIQLDDMSESLFLRSGGENETRKEDIALEQTCMLDIVPSKAVYEEAEPQEKKASELDPVSSRELNHFISEAIRLTSLYSTLHSSIGSHSYKSLSPSAATCVYDESHLTIDQFAQLCIRFLGDKLPSMVFEQFIEFIKSNYSETEDERKVKMAELKRARRLARKLELVDQLFLLWDNEGSDRIKLEQLKNYLLKYKSGILRPQFKIALREVSDLHRSSSHLSIAGQALQTASGQSTNALPLTTVQPLPSGQQPANQVGRLALHLILTKLARYLANQTTRLRQMRPASGEDELEEDVCFEELVVYLTGCLEWTLTDRLRGQARRRWLESIGNMAIASTTSLEPLFAFPKVVLIPAGVDCSFDLALVLSTSSAGVEPLPSVTVRLPL